MTGMDWMSWTMTSLERARKRGRSQRKRREQRCNGERSCIGDYREEDVRSEDSDINRHEMDISASGMKVLQATDPTLREVRIAVKERDSCERSRILFQRWLAVQKMDTS